MCKIRVLPSPLCTSLQPTPLQEQSHSRGSASSVNRSARSATVSTAASECFIVLLLWLEVKTKTRSCCSPSSLQKSHKQSLFQTNLFSAVFSIACILSSIVDLMRNLCTNVGLVDTGSSHQTAGNAASRAKTSFFNIPSPHMRTVCLLLIRER